MKTVILSVAMVAFMSVVVSAKKKEKDPGADRNNNGVVVTNSRDTTFIDGKKVTKCDSSGKCRTTQAK